MKPGLLDVLTVLSLLVFLAAAALWAAGASSGGVSRPVAWDGRRWELAARDGRFRLDPEPQRKRVELRIALEARRLDAERERLVELKIKVRQDAKAGRIADPQPLLDHLNAEQRKVMSERDAMVKTVPWVRGYSVPAAPAVAALAVLPLLRGWAVVRRTRDRQRRRRVGRCSHCDYDLAGNVSGVCPECGTNVPRVNE